MTAIVALKANGIVYMGCDSIFMDTDTYQVAKRTQSKLIVKDEMIIGITSGNGCKIFQTIQFKLKLTTTKKIPTEDLLEYMVNNFCGKLYKLLRIENLLVEDDDRKGSDPSLSPADLLIGIRGKIFQIGQDFDVAELDMPFFAIGSGGDYALGSLEATNNLLSMDPEHQVLFALKTAAKFTAGVREPFNLKNTGELCHLGHSQT